MRGSSRTQQTYRYELWRSGAAGVLETAATTFLLVIALQWFHAGTWSKAFVAAGGSLGLLLSPVVVAWTTRAGVPTSRAASRIVGFGSLMFLTATVLPVLPVYV